MLRCQQKSISYQETSREMQEEEERCRGCRRCWEGLAQECPCHLSGFPKLAGGRDLRSGSHQASSEASPRGARAEREVGLEGLFLIGIFHFSQ